MRMSSDELPQMMMSKCDVRMEKLNKLKLPSVTNLLGTHILGKKKTVSDSIKVYYFTKLFIYKEYCTS